MIVEICKAWNAAYNNRPHSIILASCKPGCKPGFRPGLQPCFRQVRAGLRHAFDQLSTFCRKPGREPQQVRWFVRVLDKWNVEKTVLSKFAAGFRHAFDLLATRFRPDMQLARIMECGLISVESCMLFTVCVVLSRFKIVYFLLFWAAVSGLFWALYKSLSHHTMVDKNEKYRKTNLTNDRKNTNKRTYMTHSSMYKFTLIYPWIFSKPMTFG